MSIYIVHAAHGLEYYVQRVCLLSSLLRRYSRMPVSDGNALLTQASALISLSLSPPLSPSLLSLSFSLSALYKPVDPGETDVCCLPCPLSAKG